jgi:hypothetical protein
VTLLLLGWVYVIVLKHQSPMQVGGRDV